VVVVTVTITATAVAIVATTVRARVETLLMVSLITLTRPLISRMSHPVVRLRLARHHAALTAIPIATRHPALMIVSIMPQLLRTVITGIAMLPRRRAATTRS
jgi:hypothetical protein